MEGTGNAKVKSDSSTGEHVHCFCLQDAIGRPLCCKCGAVLEVKAVGEQHGKEKTH